MILVLQIHRRGHFLHGRPCQVVPIAWRLAVRCILYGVSFVDLAGLRGILDGPSPGMCDYRIVRLFELVRVIMILGPANCKMLKDCPTSSGPTAFRFCGPRHRKGLGMQEEIVVFED